MIQTQTFEFHKEKKEELEVLSSAIDLIGKQRYQEAAEILIRRHDDLTKEPKLKLYDQRAG